MRTSNNRIPVAVLGATGTVGQRFVQLLVEHPWFEITALCGSDRSEGRPYREACTWRLEGSMPEAISRMIVRPLTADLPGRIVFSALPTAAAKKWEPEFAGAGYAVCTNASAFRQAEDIPLLIPEVNADHVDLIPRQRVRYGWSGLIVASPNCTTTGIAMPLKALDVAFGLESVFAVSMQAISGAGYPGIPALDINGNVYPFIRGEEEKIEPETRLLLGEIADGGRIPHPLSLMAHCNRVPVVDGHTSCISAALARRVTPEEAAEVFSGFQGPDDIRNLPSAPARPIILRSEADRPQPRLDRDAEGGMAVSVGRLRQDRLLDLAFVSLVHNTLRGAASGAILNAELLVSRGIVS